MLYAIRINIKLGEKEYTKKKKKANRTSKASKYHPTELQNEIGSQYGKSYHFFFLHEDKFVSIEKIGVDVLFNI